MAHHQIRLGSVHIIETLPPGDLRTGELLFDELEPLAMTTQPAIAAHFWREATRDGFLNRLRHIADDVRLSSRAPLLHIEAHGSPEGLQLASGECLSWLDLKHHLIAINVLCRLNLLVLLGACDGAALVEVVQVTDRAPVWGLIGPVRQVTGGELESANLAFYRTLFATRDGGVAWHAMNDAVTADKRTFALFNAEFIFRWVVQGYFEAYCTDQVLAERQSRITAELIKRGVSPQDIVAAEIKISEYLQDHRSRFDEIKERFFFCDLCPDHRERFAVCFEDCIHPPEQSSMGRLVVVPVA